MPASFINLEDFIEYAESEKIHYEDFYEEYLKETLEDEGFTDEQYRSPEALLEYCKEYTEEAEEVFDEVILPVIEQQEEDELFGAEGFNGRFR